MRDPLFVLFLDGTPAAGEGLRLASLGNDVPVVWCIAAAAAGSAAAAATTGQVDTRYKNLETWM